MLPSKLILKNNTTYAGLSPSWQNGLFGGEVVFNTGMTGYVETLTDPSYAGQIVAFTYPLIGNYGIPHKKHWESKKIHASGVVVDSACENFSHQSAHFGLFEWLKKEQVPIITGVDTRALTKILRNFGTMPAVINCGNDIKTEQIKKTLKLIPFQNKNLVKQVSIKQTKL